MNLQENIRKVLREENNMPLYIRRRFSIAREYISDLDPNDICNYWNYDDVDEFVNETLSEIVRAIVNNIPEIRSKDWYDSYDEVLGVLTDLNYHLEIRDFFINTLDNCDNYVNESTDRSERLKSKIKDMIENVGLDQAIGSVGGIENLIKILDLKDAEQFLKLFEDLNEISREGITHKLYKTTGGVNYFVVLPDNILFVHNSIVDIVSYLKDRDLHTKNIIEEWFEDRYDVPLLLYVYNIPGNEMGTLG